MRWKAAGLRATLLIFFAAGLGVGCHRQAAMVDGGWWMVDGGEALGRQQPSRPEPAANRVATLRVEPREIAREIEVTGTIQPSLTAEIAPKVMGKVAAVSVREGDRVRAGQVLVRLEAGDLAAQVRQAEAAVAASLAALAQAQTGAAIQRTQSSTRVEQAKAALRQARDQYSLMKEGSRRQQKLQADEAVRQAEAGRAQAGEGVKQARAVLAATQAQLSLVREGSRRQQKLQADAAVRQAEATFQTAEATYRRFQALLDEGAVSRLRLDEVALQLEVARSQYGTAREQASLVHEGARTQELQQAEEGVRQAEAGLRQAEQKQQEADAAARSAAAQRDLTYEGPRSQELRQAQEQVRQAEQALRMAQAAVGENRIKSENTRMLRAQLDQAEANRVAARVQLSYATLTAPFSGLVTVRSVDPGALAKPGVPLLTLVDPSGFRLEAIVPESARESVRLGASGPVTVGVQGRAVTGRIARIVPGADPSSRTFLIKIQLPQEERWTPGMFGRARLTVGKTTGLRVPESALWRQGSLAGVFVVEDGIARKRIVTIGRVADHYVEILSGLRGGERIVADHVEGVQDGGAVR
jgi:multidrug efflux pump subunit AcrA (membrane-fusion protein)